MYASAMLRVIRSTLCAFLLKGWSCRPFPFHRRRVVTQPPSPRSSCSPAAPPTTSRPPPSVQRAADGRAALAPPQRGRIWTIDDEFARIAREEIPGFAGHYIAGDGKSVVLLTDLRQQGRAAAYAAGERQALGLAAREAAARQVEYDFAQLKAWRDVLHSLVGLHGITFLDIDEVANRIWLGVVGAPVGPARSAAIAAGVPAQALVVEQTAGAERRHKLTDRAPAMRGGYRIMFNGSDGVEVCTLGYSGYLGGFRVYVTAAHCSDVTADLDGEIHYQPDLSAGNLIGYEVADPEPYDSCGFGQICRWSDAAAYQYDANVPVSFGYFARTINAVNGAVGSNEVNATYPTHYISEKYMSDLPVGTTAYKVGMSSGTTYGLVTRTCFRYQNLLCQSEADIYSRDGDSGAPIVFGSIVNPPGWGLAGILWGGPLNNYQKSWYSPIRNVEYDLGSITGVCAVGGC